MLASVLQHPRHAPVHLSGRDRLALTEEQKHEYAVRLESLGRSRDMDTKRWTALDLWHDPAVKVSQKGIADLVGVTPKTINVWVKEDEQQRQAEKNYFGNSSPTEREQRSTSRCVERSRMAASVAGSSRRDSTWSWTTASRISRVPGTRH